MTEFEEYLISKKIDPKKFKEAEKDTYIELERFYNQVSPISFTAQKLFLINPIRRRFPLSSSVTEVSSKISQKAKPKIKPRIKK